MMILRPTTTADIGQIQRWHEDAAVQRWVPISDWKTYYEAVSRLNDYYLYSVTENEQLVASLALEIYSDKAAVCLVVDPALHGKGIGTNALQEMIQQSDTLFGSVNCLIAGIFPENTGSIKCFEKAGFERTGKGKDGEYLYSYMIRRQ